MRWEGRWRIVKIKISPRSRYCKNCFLFSFSSSFEGRKDQKSCGRPVQKTVSLVKKKTHTHTFSGCSPGCCLARRTNSVEFGFSILLRAASMRHADFARVWTNTTRVTSSCVREYVLWIHVRNSYVPSEQWEIETRPSISICPSSKSLRIFSTTNEESIEFMYL